MPLIWLAFARVECDKSNASVRIRLIVPTKIDAGSVAAKIPDYSSELIGSCKYLESSRNERSRSGDDIKAPVFIQLALSGKEKSLLFED